MKLAQIKLSNFKCFGEEETIIHLDEKMTTFVGCNSSGKSSIMEAILKLISQNSNQRVIKKTDFHIPKGKILEDIEEIKMYIELVFSFNELTKDSNDISAVSANFRHLVVNGVGEVPILRIRLDSVWSKSSNPEGSIDTEINYITSSDDTSIENNKQIAKRKDLDLIRAIYVPSMRNIEKEIKYVSGTLMQRIFNLVKWDDSIKTVIKDKSDNLNNELINNTQVNIISNSISKNWKKFNVDKKFTDTKIEFSSSEISEILRKIDIGFGPSFENRNYLLPELGDGSRSLFYFSLVNALLDIEQEFKNFDINNEEEHPLLTIIIAEEPENHISPHLLGQLVSSLSDICGDNSQVIITSHSPSIIERIDPEKIRLVRNEIDFTSSVTNVNIPKDALEAYKLIKETIQKHPQLYFSKIVILVEGDTEKYVIPKLLKARDIDLDLNSISILTLDSRFVDKIWYVLKNLNIKYITFIDLDNERKCGGYHKLKYLLSNIKKLDLEIDENFHDGKNIFDNDISKALEDSPFDLENKYFMDLICFLENKDIIFSYPLDFDFMMLKSYKDKYINSLDNNETGPKIKNLTNLKDILDISQIINNTEYLDKLKIAVQHSLKDEGGNGESFKNDIHLLIWYDYFFLGKGKVNTHFKVFSKITEKEINDNLPTQLIVLIKKIEEFIHG